MWMFIRRLRSEPRMMIKGHSWWIETTGLPWPEIWLSERSGSWSFDLGWFTLWWMKPRRRWTKAMREGNPSRQTKIVEESTQ